MSILTFPIISQWKLQVAIAEKVHDNKIVFVEATVMNVAAKFQIYPLIASEEMIFSCHDNQSNGGVWTKMMCLGEI